MPDSGKPRIRKAETFTDVESALARVTEIYDTSTAALAARLERFLSDEPDTVGEEACYPCIEVTVGPDDLSPTNPLAYGNFSGVGTYGTTLTQPRLFENYYREQLDLLVHNHDCALSVGISDCPIPLPFVAEAVGSDVADAQVQTLQRRFPMPDLSQIDDTIANGTFQARPGVPLPLALFTAERVDYSLVRLAHYTATASKHFQRFVLFTNYQRYVDEFVAYGREQVKNGAEYSAFVEPGNRVTPNPRLSDAPPSGKRPRVLPQMPAYHLVRDDHEGITLVNIGIGPSNAKTITDHIAVLRPHCWIMVGHCGGLRKSQRLGDYVLAHAYARGDHVLDEDLPDWVPVPPIAEVQVALSAAVSSITGLTGRELKVRLRTGTVFTTDDRDWELRHADLSKLFNQTRAIAVDMESATIAANGYRFRVPYGTLLCVSDKPLHGDIKLPGMANAFYRQRVSQHIKIGIEAVCQLRDAGVETLHSRKLRSFDEPAFR
jgi:AMP nucleosidase